MYVDSKHYRPRTVGPPNVAASKAASITSDTWRNISDRALALAAWHMSIKRYLLLALSPSNMTLWVYPATRPLSTSRPLTPRIGNVLTLP